VALLGRAALVILAFLIACAAAGVVVTIALLGPEMSAASGESGLISGFWMLVLLAAGFSGAVAIVPLFLLVVVAEAFRLRSLLLYVVVTAAAIPFGYFWSGFADHLEPDAAYLSRGHEAAIAATAGIVLGFVYWLLAGRRAGAWRRPGTSRAPGE